ncbi:MAG: hypothetical protein GXO47_07925 [Chlorobi bacterium]|nr:hypothetical protein [Chlorobiota bacterium]
MKQLTYILTLIAATLLSSCEPQMDQAPDLGPSPSGEVSINDAAQGENYKILTVNAQNAFMYTWDLGNGLKAHGETVESYYPFSGSYTIKCTISGKAGSVTVEKNITINRTDPDLASMPGIKELTNSGAGRTWVFYHDNPDPDGAFFYMTANYDWEEFWWDPVADDCCRTPEIANDSIRFDLNGAFNYTVYHNGEANKGTFLYNEENGTLQLVDANLPYFEINEEEGLLNQDAFATGLFMINMLNDTQLRLWQDQTSDDYDYGWMWVFTPAQTD